MMNVKERSSLPGAAEMAECFRNPQRKKDLKGRIEDHYSNLRMEIQKPEKKDPLLIRKYSQIMARLRAEEEILMEMLESFSRGDACSVRDASTRLTEILQDKKFSGNR